MRLSRPAAATFAGLSALALAACASSGDDAAQESGSSNASSASFPVVIEHAFGETTIEAAPERVATVGWSNQEVALAFDIVPVVMEEATWGDDDGDGVLPWVEAKLEDLGAETPALYDGTDGIDFEAIADADPDVILSAYSGLSEDDYATLSEIAPVVAFPGVAWGTSWQDTILMDGAGLGFEAEAEELVAEEEAAITEAVAGYEHLGAGQGAAFAFFDVADLSSVGFYSTADPRTAFLSEFAGFEVPQAVADPGTDEFYFSVSAEAVDTLSDLDVIVTYGTGEELAALQADPLLSRIPAIASGAVVFLDVDTDPSTTAAANPSPLAIDHLIEHYLPLLDEAAATAS